MHELAQNAAQSSCCAAEQAAVVLGKIELRLAHRREVVWSPSQLAHDASPHFLLTA